MEPIIDSDNTTLEFRNSLNEVIKSVSLTKNEAEVAPHLIKVRLLLQQGKPSEALDLLMEVVRKTQGDKGVNDIMEKGKQQYSQLCDEEENKEKAEEQHQSFLELQGKGSIIAGAYNDNSSSICDDCHGLIANSRLESHKLLWCPAIINNTSTVTTNKKNSASNNSTNTTSTTSTISSHSNNNSNNTKACGACSKPASLLCGRCKAVSYCSKNCQSSHWNTHKKVCKS